MVPEYLAFSRMIDDLGLWTFEAYCAAGEQITTGQSTALTELSTPVVRLWDGIIAVPPVGTLDSARTQVMMEKLLDALMATPVNAARLLGAQCTNSGIRPRVAQTIVSLGIEFGDIATRATLADALALALHQAGLKIVPAS